MPTLLNKSLGSADLTKPQASGDYILKATLAIGALFLAASFGQQLAAWAGNTARGFAGITPSQGFSFAA